MLSCRFMYGYLLIIYLTRMRNDDLKQGFHYKFIGVIYCRYIWYIPLSKYTWSNLKLGFDEKQQNHHQSSPYQIYQCPHSCLFHSLYFKLNHTNIVFVRILICQTNHQQNKMMTIWRINILNHKINKRKKCHLSLILK